MAKICDVVLKTILDKSGCKEVRDLLNAGINVNTQNGSGETPLHIAAKWNHYNMCAMLLEYNPDVFIESAAGVTPFQLMYKNDLLCPMLLDYIKKINNLTQKD